MKNLPMPEILVCLALAAGALLLVPLAAMQFTREVSWGWLDFLLAGALLFTAGTAIELAIRRFKRPAQRNWSVLAIAVTLALVWAELSVGLFR